MSMLSYHDLPPIPRLFRDGNMSVEACGNADTVSRHDADSFERRERSAPVPVNLCDYLTDEQRVSVEQMREYGWQLAFVRRPLFLDPVIVVTNEDQTRMGVLEIDGSINTHVVLNLRQQP